MRARFGGQVCHFHCVTLVGSAYCGIRYVAISECPWTLRLSVRVVCPCQWTNLPCNQLQTPCDSHTVARSGKWKSHGRNLQRPQLAQYWGC